MKNFGFFKMAILISLVFNVTLLRAQVTVGSEKLPEPFSLLELVSNGSNGLRLPQLLTSERDAMTTTSFKGNSYAKGLMIYNRSTRCLEFWNGAQWISRCDGAMRYMVANNDNDVFVPVFMTYNIGATPVATHKAYMAKFAEGRVSNTDETRYGSFFLRGSVAENPCPAGWRAPAREEWELLSNFTWVPVRCDSDAGACYDYNDNQSWSAADNTVNKGGYAIYRTTEWTAFRNAHPNGRQNLLTADAPEPYLFLPSAGSLDYANGSFTNGVFGYYHSSSTGDTTFNVRCVKD